MNHWVAESVLMPGAGPSTVDTKNEYEKVPVLEAALGMVEGTAI